MINGGMGIIFKGSGFYVTDNGGSKGRPASDKPSDKSSASSAPTSSSTSSATPAASACANCPKADSSSASKEKAAG
jgi:predicted nucleic acid-binding Zn ribbon protein